MRLTVVIILQYIHIYNHVVYMKLLESCMSTVTQIFKTSLANIKAKQGTVTASLHPQALCSILPPAPVTPTSAHPLGACPHTNIDQEKGINKGDVASFLFPVKFITLKKHVPC